jgi:excisionase family DNA binding protein
MPERTYTTHDIAKVCDVYPSSVVNWIDSGKLKAYATPGGHHRVTREDLLSFLKRFDIPIPKKLSVRETRILVVDDDVEVTRVVARAFDRCGDAFATEACHSGIEALIRIGQEPPDLVILDIVMPKMDGLQVCKVLKSQPETRGIKIIAISGKKPPFNEKRPQEAKVDAFFRKPLDLIELLSKSAELLGVGLELGSGAKHAQPAGKP